MNRSIKSEPVVELPKWSLIAVSEAARKNRSLIVLEPSKTYDVGRSRSNAINFPSPFCSKKHCTLEVSENEVIMKDQSTHGTRVNRVNYKESRCILSEGDLLGFGCSTSTRHLKDKQDVKYYVYRVKIGSDLASCEPIELLDSSDDSDGGDRYSGGFFVDGNETDDECPSADEIDVKPDIHTLMRIAQEKVQIKEEINWNCYEYDRSQMKETVPFANNADDPICLSDNDEEIVMVEPPQKRIRTESHTDFLHPTPEPTPTDRDEYGNSTTENESDASSSYQVSEKINILPEYQMSNTALKEKVKIVVRSRGQQLATDMLRSQKTLMSNMNEALVTTHTTHAIKGHKMPKGAQTLHHEPSTSSAWHFKAESDTINHSIDDLKNYFISEVTKWDFQWIYDKKLNPLRYTMNVEQLATDFIDLAYFQRQMKSLLFMEAYSIIFTDYWSKTRTQQTFTYLQSCSYNIELKRYVYKCFAQKKECQVSEIIVGDFTVVTHGKGKFLAYVTNAQRTNDGWEFEMQASKLEKDANNAKSKCVQVVFVTNIQVMLECFISLYELRKSSLQEVFLRPCSQFEEEYDPTENEFIKKDRASILSKIYEKCACSIVGSSRILLVNGGAGSGKTRFIYDLLERFASEKFQFTNSILVCGRNNILVDRMAARVLPKISNIARFGKISTMRKDIHRIGVEKFSSRLQQVNVVFITLNNAVDLLHADRTFDVCIVDDASLCSEAELLPLFRLKLTTLLLVGDEMLQTTTTQNECCRENGYSRSLFTRAIESFKKFNSERILYPTLHKQRRMHPDIASWPNKIFYNNKMDLSPIVRMRRSPFKPYTVFQVNTIEDIEIEFVWQLLEFCFKIIKPNRCSYGIICGNPTSKDLIAEMIKTNEQFAGVEVSDYDSLQGREKDVILMIALKPDDGFQLFSTMENLSIALTRAKGSLVFCGNFQHVCTNIDGMTSTWNSLLDDAKSRNRFFDTNGTFDEAQIKNMLPLQLMNRIS